MFVFSIICWKLYVIWAHFSKHKWHKSSSIFTWFQRNIMFRIRIYNIKYRKTKFSWLGNKLQSVHRKCLVWQFCLCSWWCFWMSKNQLHDRMAINGLRFSLKEIKCKTAIKAIESFKFFLNLSQQIQFQSERSLSMIIGCKTF